MSFLASSLAFCFPAATGPAVEMATFLSGAQRSAGFAAQPWEMHTTDKRNAKADHSWSSFEWANVRELNRLALAFVPLVRTHDKSGADFSHFWRSNSVLSDSGRPASSKIEGKNSSKSGSDGAMEVDTVSATSFSFHDQVPLFHGPYLKLYKDMHQRENLRSPAADKAK